MNLSQRIVLALLRPLFKIFISWEVKGRGNIPPAGPFILVANHVHVLDPVLLALSFPRWINFLAKEELFHYPFLRRIVRWAQASPIRRKGTIKDNREILKQAKSILSRGLVLGMFPEGRRSRQAKLSHAKPGAAVLASQMNVSLLPVGVIGTGEYKGMGWLWRRPHIVINIGQPFKLPSLNNKLTKSQIKSLKNQLMSEIAALLPPENRGIYGD